MNIWFLGMHGWLMNIWFCVRVLIDMVAPPPAGFAARAAQAFGSRGAGLGGGFAVVVYSCLASAPVG